MKITPICIKNYQLLKKTVPNTVTLPIEQKQAEDKFYRTNFLPTFGHFKMHDNEIVRRSYSTAFYRDIIDLSTACDEIRKSFPKGTNVLDFACSNGEETISLYTMLNPSDIDSKYKIRSYDSADLPLSIAQQGIYVTVKDCHDDWIIDNKGTFKYGSPSEPIKSRFFEIMEESDIPKINLLTENDIKSIEFWTQYHENIKSSDIAMKYIKLKDKYKSEILFHKRDIREIEKVLPNQEVGAVFFRNAFYHAMHNYLKEEDVSKLFDIDRQEIVNDIVDKVYERLAPGGIFVIGRASDEHLCLIDRTTKSEDIYERLYDYSKPVLKYSPVVKSLRERGFTPLPQPVFKCYHIGETIPIVWKKLT